MNLLHTTTHRIAHGTDHMPATALVMRVAVVLFGTGMALTISNPWIAALCAAITAVSGVVALWELHDAAVECEESGDDVEDQGDEFGTAA